MRLSAALTEGWRNAATSPRRTLSIAFSFAVLIGLLGASSAWTLADLTNKAAEFRASGASTIVTTAKGSINGTVCRALTSSPEVSAAGALRPAADLTFTSLPGANVPAFEVTPGFLPIVASTAGRPEGIYISQQVAEQLGKRVGDQVFVGENAEPTRIAGVYPFPEDGRRSELAFAVLLPVTDDQPFDQCWAKVWPLTDTTRNFAGLSVSAQTSEAIERETVQLNASRGTSFDGARRYQERLTANAAVWSLLGAALIAAAGISARRVELSSNLHAGVSRASLSVMTLVETLLQFVPAAAVSALLLALTLRLSPGTDPESLNVEIAKVVGGGLAGAAAGSLLALSLVRESRLFTYFKAR